MYQDEAVPAAALIAVRNPGVGHEEERVRVSAGSDGWGELTLAPGMWYLLARSDEREIFGWFGSNPLQVRPGEAVEIAVRGVAAGPPPRSSAAPPGEETVAGEVSGEDGPLARASVAFYLDASSQFRGPGYLEAQTDDEGRFEARISPGRYYLVVRRRSGPAAFGPLEAGDAFGFYAGNPLYLRSGERLSLQLAAVRVMKKSGWSAPSALRTRVSGTIRDAAGRPLAGYRAFLHAKPSMLGKPEFVSEPSDADGRYTIWVDREGKYYLGARAEIGRAREEKEPVGLYGGTPDHGIVVLLEGAELLQMDVAVGAGEAGR
jgi:hypothetical protein